jgi:hypothetical protein
MGGGGGRERERDGNPVRKIIASPIYHTFAGVVTNLLFVLSTFLRPIISSSSSSPSSILAFPRPFLLARCERVQKERSGKRQGSSLFNPPPSPPPPSPLSMSAAILLRMSTMMLSLCIYIYRCVCVCVCVYMCHALSPFLSLSLYLSVGICVCIYILKYIVYACFSI